jgi:hypothetical protein
VCYCLRAKKWVECIGRLDLMTKDARTLNKNHFVCSDHFPCTQLNEHKTVLLDGAMPTVRWSGATKNNLGHCNKKDIAVNKKNADNILKRSATRNDDVINTNPAKRILLNTGLTYAKVFAESSGQSEQLLLRSSVFTMTPQSTRQIITPASVGQFVAQRSSAQLHSRPFRPQSTGHITQLPRSSGHTFATLQSSVNTTQCRWCMMFVFKLHGYIYIYIYFKQFKITMSIK